MVGTGASLFSPDGVTTRGQVVTILWRLSGSPAVSDPLYFDDVNPTAWYGEAIRWAAAEGIVRGYGNNRFGPNDPATREQLATLLYRFARGHGCDVSVGEDTNLLSYEDSGQLSEYAIPALQWACGAGIVRGTGEGTLLPLGQTTRAQAAVMLQRFCQQCLGK